MLLFTACSGGSGGDVTTPFSSPWLGGNDALTMDFLDGEPPTELLDMGEEPFSISIEVKNMGEDEIPIEEATFELKGVAASDLGVTQDYMTQRPEEVIEARTKNPDTGNAIESPSTFITWNELAYLPDLAGNTYRDFYVEACYIYDTYITADLCIKENLRDTSDTDVCIIAGAKEIANSGAPVQVESLEEFGSGEDAIRFTFKINHVSTTGNVYRLGTGCLDTPQNENKVQVRVNVPTFDSSALTCSGLTDATVEDDWAVVGFKNIGAGGAEVNCKLEVPEDEKFDGVASADIMLSYDFAQAISTNVLIKSAE